MAIPKYSVLDVFSTMVKIEAHLLNGPFVLNRFGDGEIKMMAGEDEYVFDSPRFPGLAEELIEAANIKHPDYLKAVSLDYPLEEGMTPTLFAPFNIKRQLEEMWFNKILKTDERVFLNQIAFPYLAVFKPAFLLSFLKQYIVPKKKMFVGSCLPCNMEALFGHITEYVVVRKKAAYENIDSWYPEVVKKSKNVDLIIMCAGFAGKVANKRLWVDGLQVQSIDFGALVDAMDNYRSRSWIHEKADQIREDFNAVY